MAFNKDRREFLRTAAILGLSAGAFLIFEQACSSVDSTDNFDSLLATPQSKVTPASTRIPRPTSTATGTSSSYTVSTPTVTPAPTTPPVAASSYAVSTPIVAPQPEGGGVVYLAPTVSPDPYENPMTDPRVRMGHLLRRAGFGASREEADKFLDMGEEKTVSFLLAYDQVDDTDLEERISALNLDRSGHSFNTSTLRLVDLQHMAVTRMIYTGRPLQEKMVLFWHGLLTSAFRKVGAGPYMLDQDDLFRQHALSPYDGLLKAVAKDPAMLIWLDSRVNKKNKPNENFARELMELFSMGVGTFTEEDVREAARGFTGWSLRNKTFFFETQQHDFGMKTFLGVTGNHDGTDIVDIIMEQPITSLFISKKLFEFFAYDNPEPRVLAELSNTFNSSGYSIKAVVEQILTSDEFYSERAYRAKIKSPTELVVGAMRQLKVDTNWDRIGPRFLTPMGQELFNPFDVSGWPDGDEWINSSTLLNRLNFVNLISRGTGNFNHDIVGSIKSRNIDSTVPAVDYFLDLFLDGVVADEEKAVMVGYLDGLLTKNGPKSSFTKSTLGSLIYLVMSSPDYQLA